MTVIQRLPSPTVGAPQPFIVGRPYSLDAAADGGDLIMLSTTQFELIGHAQYAVVAGSSFDDITCTTIKQLSFAHPAGPIDITPNTPLGFETNDHLLAKVVFSSTNGTLAIATVIYPACP